MEPADLLEKQRSYWEGCEPTIDGMLGGYEAVHPADVVESKAFIADILPDPARRIRALDCGAGIGRVTQNVLIPSGFKTVDLLDISPVFLQTARDSIPPQHLGDLYESGLAEFDFAGKHQWTLVWVQWCAIYLKDDAFISFFQRAAQAVDPEVGVVVLKENILRNDAEPIPDDSDASVTRSDKHLKRLWRAAGLTLVKQVDQLRWPSSLFPVRMYALRLSPKQ
jgi:protein N-terminal methyltransferase